MKKLTSLGEMSHKVPPSRKGILTLLVLCLLLTACSVFGGGNTTNTTGPTATVPPAPIVLIQLHWCAKALISFRDEGASTSPTGTATTTAQATVTPGAATPTPQILTDWAQVEPNLGFSVYLPTTLPARTCLVSAFGTLHDPILGGSFTIGYLLPNHSSISLSEAPLRSQSPTFQCNLSSSATSQGGSTPTVGTAVATPSLTPLPLQVCSGVRDTTNIILNARGSVDTLQTFFNALQPHVSWVPSS